MSTTTVNPRLPLLADVLALAERAADYQLASLAAGHVPSNAHPETREPANWVQATFFVGLTELAQRSCRPVYRSTIMLRGVANGWALGPRTYHADDHLIGQAYLWAAQHGAGTDALAPMRKQFDEIVASPSRVPLGFHAEPGVDCLTRWCWCDALFMAPAAWAEMSRVTGDPRYLRFAEQELKAAADYLYDRDEHLFYRDSRFFTRRGPDGEKVFWSRGNGWVFAGLARLLARMPQDDPAREGVERMFHEMAARLKRLQKADGFWAPSLLGNPAQALPESSGTALFTYGFAWGVKAGLLDAADYLPVVRRGWSALARSLHPDGKLGYVQPVGDQPDRVDYEDTQFYGVGAFLLAACAIADLALEDGR